MGYEQLNVRIPAGLAERFDQELAAQGVAKKHVVVGLVRCWVERCEQGQSLGIAPAGRRAARESEICKES